MADFVIDASVTLPWCFEDEASPYTDQLLNDMAAGMQAVVPAHWPMEVLNALLKAKKRGRVTETVIRRFLEDIGSFDILVEQNHDTVHLNRVRTLAEKHNLTSYDAAYLELARRTGTGLATLDEELKRAAISEGIRQV